MSSAVNANAVNNNNQVSIQPTYFQVAKWASSGEISFIQELFEKNKKEARKFCGSSFVIQEKHVTPFHYAVKFNQWKICALFINYGVRFDISSQGTSNSFNALQSIDQKLGAFKKIVQELVNSKKELNFNFLLKLFMSNYLSVSERKLVYQDGDLCESLCRRFPRKEDRLLLMASLLIGSFKWSATAGEEFVAFLEHDKKNGDIPFPSNQPITCWHLFVYASFLTGVPSQYLKKTIMGPIMEVSRANKPENAPFAIKEEVIRLMGCQKYIPDLDKIKGEDVPRIICFCQCESELAVDYHFVLCFKRGNTSYVIQIGKRTTHVVCQTLETFLASVKTLFKNKKGSKIEAFEGMIPLHVSLSTEDEKSD